MSGKTTENEFSFEELGFRDDQKVLNPINESSAPVVYGQLRQVLITKLTRKSRRRIYFAAYAVR